MSILCVGFRFFQFSMYEDWTQNYDPEIHEDYTRHTHYPATSFIAVCRLA